MPAVAVALVSLAFSATGYALASNPTVSPTMPTPRPAPAPASEEAFAHVAGSGVLVNPATEARGIKSSDVLRSSTGHYCIKGLDFAPHGATATAATFLSRTISVALGAGVCPSGTQLEVITALPGVGAIDTPFFIRIY